ncbi:hypothetical protein ABD76_28030 [Paenibacillus dendritiformis]|uniref:hypothetical protein n=1 Tax=Paenibacillus dendritiformis TaxID=130049 RepID=UPI0018CCA2E3|nr:hypothetical protein [Paenibacillus dendritiformis]MBG9796071.1 hypothetical protein [Paenibacillus dendritiformis]
MKVSPFSMTHEWQFKPTFLPEGTAPGYAPLRAATEAEGLKSIGLIGCIGSVQMGRLFQWKRHQIRRMLAEKKLIQHLLLKNKNTIPIYTIGPRAAQLLNLEWTHEFWRTWTIEQILSKLVFFQFCCAMRDKQKAFQINLAPFPFTGRVEIGKDSRNILVIRGETDHLVPLLRHSSHPMIVIAESLIQVKPLNNILKNAKLLLDIDLKQDYRFYRQVEGEWGYK